MCLEVIGDFILHKFETSKILDFEKLKNLFRSWL